MTYNEYDRLESSEPITFAPKTMNGLYQCPECSQRVRVLGNVNMAACPKCSRVFALCFVCGEPRMTRMMGNGKRTCGRTSCLSALLRHVKGR